MSIAIIPEIQVTLKILFSVQCVCELVYICVCGCVHTEIKPTVSVDAQHGCLAWDSCLEWEYLKSAFSFLESKLRQHRKQLQVLQRRSYWTKFPIIDYLIVYLANIT